MNRLLKCVICLFLGVARHDALASSECYRVAKWDNVMALQCEVLASLSKHEW